MKTTTKSKILYLTVAAMIAALYVVLTYFSALFGLDSKAVQLRFSEALCILPVFTSAAIPGLTVGCIIANLIFTGNIFDIIFGSLATLIGALFTWLLRKRNPVLFEIPPILSNAIIVPLVLKFAYGLEDSYWFILGTVTLGEVISIGIFGTLLYFALKKRNINLK